jgi:glutamate synthase domain-containing protein 3
LVSLDNEILGDLQPYLDCALPFSGNYQIRNHHLTVGARVAGVIAEQHGDEGLPPGSVRLRFTGTAGQSFGAFLSTGVALRLVGIANDYVGKGMGGGLISIRPEAGEPGAAAHGAGNACLYGATGGALYVAGTVGQRFAVRNSGATAVIEGASDHCCEYMTGGRVAVIGPVGRNVAAGMTGGVLYVWDPEAKPHFAESAPTAARLEDGDATEVRQMLHDHIAETRSRVAERIVDRWDEARHEFWVLRANTPIADDQPVLDAAVG